MFVRVETIEARLRECTPPLEIEDHGRLNVWLPPLEKIEYVVGVDPAGGGPGGDYACAQVVQRRNGLQCAELHGHFSQKELGERVVMLARRYNRALLAIERNNHGHGVLMYVREKEKYPHLYESNGQLGWETNAVTRPDMIDGLVTIFDNEPKLFASERLLRECRTFVRRADGSGEAAAGTHDDTVIAMAIAQEVARQKRRPAHRVRG